MPRRVTVTKKPNLSAPLDMKLLGQLVRFRRTSLDMTLEDAAGLCGLSKQAYNNVEKCVENVRTDTLFKVLSAMGIKLRIQEETMDMSDDWI